MVPLSRRSLVLPANPPSVKLARSWVARVLEDIGRDDLVDSARLGVTELVTNALIHSRPPLSIRVRGTVDHPRIEVVDSSPVPPQRSSVVTEAEDVDEINVTTFGRGLALVAMTASRWGSDLGLDGRSKSVWFEPANDTEAGGGSYDGEVFDLERDLDVGEIADEERVHVRLEQVPARLFGAWRRYFFELRRELRLLSIASPEEYPLAAELTDILIRADRERRMTDGIDVLDDAISAGQERVDLHLEITASTPGTMANLRDLLAEVVAEFSEEHLLAVRPPDVIVELQDWYFTEYERQARGEAPKPWDGPVDVPHL